jgi:hypothetical protein
VKFCEYQSRCGRQITTQRKTTNTAANLNRNIMILEMWQKVHEVRLQKKQDTLQISRIVSITSGKKAHQRQYKALRIMSQGTC